jgi:hypothetical protein
MALNTDPNFPPSGNPPYAINREWCLGDSLFFLNRNFENFDSRIDSLSSNTNSRITSLSTVPYARLNDGNQSGPAPIFGARAWVNFDGTRDTNSTVTAANTDRLIYGSGNVSSVKKEGLGIFTLTFATPMLNTGYSLIGTGNQNIPSGGNVTFSVYWTGTTTPILKTVNAVRFCVLDTDVGGFGTVDPLDASIVIFG